MEIVARCILMPAPLSCFNLVTTWSLTAVLVCALVATQTGKTWTYRYKDAANRMKQVRIGQWPVMPAHAAATAWQALRDQREAGVDPAAQRKAQRQCARVEAPAVYTVRKLVQDFKDGHLRQSRKLAGFDAAENMFDRIFEDKPGFADKPADEVDARRCVRGSGKPKSYANNCAKATLVIRFGLGLCARCRQARW
jgi:hypothetical protein